MRHETLYFSCGVCGLSTGTVENDIEEGEDDTQMPPGWVEVTAKRVSPNPDWSTLKTVDEILENLVTEVVKAQGDPPDGVDPRNMLRQQAEMQAVIAEQTNPAQFIIEEVQFHVSPEHLGALLELDNEAFDEMGWKAPEPKKEEEEEKEEEEVANES